MLPFFINHNVLVDYYYYKQPNRAPFIYFFIYLHSDFYTMNKYFQFLFLFLPFLSISAQNISQIEPVNYIFDDAIKSVKVTLLGQSFGQPILKIGSGDQLELVFDDLDQKDRYLKYTLIHCTHDWKISPLNPIEYLDGFLEDEISEFQNSFNTIQHYTRYSLKFPNDLLRITKSGNYLLFVYDDTPDRPVLTRRVMIEEATSVGISGVVDHAVDVNYRDTKQQVDFTVYSANYAIRNPSMYLHATIMQNGRWDNAISGLTYRSLKPGEFNFYFDNLNLNLFPGSSEFRTFDTRTLRNLSNRIVSVNFDDQVNQAYVMEDMARPFGLYETNTTLKGACYWANNDFQGDITEDYVLTHFTLRADFRVSGGDLYLFGELTDWRIIPDAKLVYNPETKYWEASIYLKQGFYNYQYVFVPKNQNDIDATYIEGSHWQTNNDYTILIYLQEEGTSYDKLIGSKILNIKK